MLNLDNINAFVTSVEKGSFSSAARHLGKSQSSVSIGVANLELDLGIALFDRATKYPTLTPQGERLYQQAKILLRQSERIEAYALGVVEEVEDLLVISVDPMLPLSIVDSALAKLSDEFPHTQVNLVKYAGKDSRDALLSGDTTISINIPLQAVPENLDFITIIEIEWVCACSPDSKFADLELVDNETLIAERQIICSSMLENPVLESNAVMSQVHWQASDVNDLIRLVEQDLGWAFVPKDLFIERESLGTLIQFTPEFNKATIHLAVEMTWRSNLQMGPVARKFKSLLTE